MASMQTELNGGKRTSKATTKKNLTLDLHCVAAVFEKVRGGEVKID